MFSDTEKVLFVLLLELVPLTFNITAVLMVKLVVRLVMAGVMLNVTRCGTKLSMSELFVDFHFTVGSSFNSVAYVGDTLKLYSGICGFK